jgi:hypothetical protein
VDVPVSTAVPESVAPHCALVNADTVTFVVTWSNVVADDPSEDEPSAPKPAEPGTNAPAPMGPVPAGQVASAVTRRHNCGASPTADTLADGVTVPDAPMMSTTKDGCWPEVATDNVDRSTGVPGVRDTPVQPTMSEPLSVRTVSVALVKPDVGVSSVNDFHESTDAAEEHPIRGTAVCPESTARRGEMLEQPVVPVSKLNVLCTGEVWRPIQTQLAIAGSGVTV